MLRFCIPMRNYCIGITSFIGILLFSMVGNAQSECPSFPKVTFWGELTHASVRQHIEDKLSGDWNAYLNQLQNQHKALLDIYGRGSGAVIKRNSKKIKLSGDQLAKYLKFAKSRISVVQCLAELEDAAGLAGFSTAAGTPEEKEGFGLDKNLERTYITIPKDLLEKLRKMAVRKSLRKTRKIGVSEIIVDILERDLIRR